MKIHRTQARFHRCLGMMNSLMICGLALFASLELHPASAQSIGREHDYGQPTHQLVHNNQSFQLISATDVPTAADKSTANDIQLVSDIQLAENIQLPPSALADDSVSIIDQAGLQLSEPSISGNVSSSIAQVGYHGACQSCGTHCSGNCGSRRSRGPCRACGMLCGGVCNQWVDPCRPCDPYWYVHAELLYWERDGEERFSLTPNYRMGGFEHELAGRITVGSVPDCVHGLEATFTGLFEWDMGASSAMPAGALQSIFTPGANLVAGNLSAFNTGVLNSQQRYTADYWSAELNRTAIGWDVAKILYGFRYIDYDEHLSFSSFNNTNQFGQFDSLADNQLFGIQAGLDLMYPISKRGYVDLRTRIGGYLNFVDTTVSLVNDGTRFINNADDDVEVAGIFELGSGLRFQIGRSLMLRASSEFMYMAGMQESVDLFSSVVSPSTTGLVANPDSEIVVAGFTLSAQIKY